MVTLPFATPTVVYRTKTTDSTRNFEVVAGQLDGVTATMAQFTRVM
jgi:hypothetical protein